MSSAFSFVLALPCRRHDAAPGEPCWTVEGHRALCGRRIGAMPVRRKKVRR